MGMRLARLVVPLLLVALGLKAWVDFVDSRNGLPGATISLVIVLLPLMSPLLHLKDILLPDSFEAAVTVPIIRNLLVPSLGSENVGQAPDYSDEVNTWAASGFMNDPADIQIHNPELPAEKTLEHERPVDCFFLPPTTFYDPNYWNSPWNNSLAMYLHDEAILTQQATIFNRIARIYSPRFRQVTGFSYFAPAHKATRAQEAADLAYSDIKRAFEYYLENWNEGGSRPIILAGHSQGAEYVLRLVRDYFAAGKPLHNQLVAAYAVGMPVYKTHLAEWGVKECTHPNDYGCVISWQSYIQGSDPSLFFYDPIDPTLKRPAEAVSSKSPEKLCVNPLSWISDDSPFVSEQFNLGAMHLVQYYQNINYLGPQIKGSVKEMQLDRLSKSLLPLSPKLVGGQCINGSFFVTDPPYFQVDDWVHLFLPLWRTFHFPGSNLHPYDYNLVYENVRKNAKDRVDSYNSRH